MTDSTTSLGSSYGDAMKQATYIGPQTGALFAPHAINSASFRGTDPSASDPVPPAHSGDQRNFGLGANLDFSG
jgi:hypothetical protein